MTSLSSLIERLSKATEGSEALNEEIARAVLVPTRAVNLLGDPPNTPAIQMYRFPNGSEGTALRFSQSIDAALSLRAKGTLWAAISMEDGPIARLVWPGGYIEAKANTVPLALVIACLKART